MTSIPMTGAQHDRAGTAHAPARPHLVVQILGLLLFGGFAIVATVLAFVMFWPAGLVLAVLLAWLGFGPILNQGRTGNSAIGDADGAHRPSVPTGNTSFDTYRAEVLTRLEDEQKTFVSFLDRLRDAKDKAQFDRFMEDRARANREADAASVGATDVPAKGEY